MRFLMTLWWMVVAVVIGIFSYRNWDDVTLALWGPLQADIKLPLLMALMIALGALPVWLVMRGRLWAVKRKLMVHERPIVTAPPVPMPVHTESEDTLAP
ncbi:MAG: hypothetical protein ABIT69_07475 [Sphingomicrobium sp.]